MRPRRIVYVLNIFPKLSETFIAGELAELSRRGIELRILSLLPPRPEIQHAVIRRAGLDTLTEYDVSRFESVVAAFQPDLLHAHFAKDATKTARALSVASGVPFTFTAHGYDIYRKPPPDFHERALAAQAVVTVSQANAGYIHRTFQVPRDHVHVIPCGIDIRWFSPATAAVQASELPHVVCVARHVEVKNLGLLLRACALLRDRGVPHRCIMIGDGPSRAHLESERTKFELNSIVTMLGAAEQADVRKWWQRATVGVLCSTNEGMPISLMEAAACGVPIVATRVGGVPEMVQDGVTGLLTPAGDAIAFADALEKLLGDVALRRRMGLAARRWAEDRFSICRHVDALLALWSNLSHRGGT